jgi:hypothetical protein
LRQSYDDLASAGEFERLLVFASQRRSAIARRTMGDFRPALPVTLEGLAHAGVGLVLGYGLGALIAAAAGALLALRRRQPISPPQASALALMVSAWTRVARSSASAALTMRWRSIRLLPSKARDTSLTEKWVSPSGRAPEWPA